MKNLAIAAFTVFFSTQLFAKNTDLSIGLIQEWSTFNPITSQLASNEALFPFIIRKIVRRGVDGSVIADIAEKVPALKNENSKYKATWVLRSNAKWADGQPITCADWALGWKAGLNPKVSVEARGFYSKIENIEWAKTTPKTCVVTYTSGDWSYDRDLPPVLPSHVEQAVYDKFANEPEGYDRNTLYIGEPTNKALYSGPYYVSEFKLGSHIILTRNPNFYGTAPKIQRVIVKLISDTSALKANLMAEQINMISAVGFPPDTALLFDDEFKRTKSNLTVHFQNSGIFQGLYFNLDSELFKDAKVREALSHAVDKETIVKAFFNNQLQAADGILSPQHPAFQKPAKIYSIQKANQILDESGWKLNSKGIREKSGKQLVFVFKTSAGLKVLENIQVYICEKFKLIGAMCTIKNEPPRTLLGQSVPRGEFDMAMYGQPLPPDTSISSYFSSKEIPTAQNSWAGGNQTRMSSKELDQLLADFDHEPARAKRNAIIRKIENVITKNYYLIPLYHRREAIVMPKNLSGVTDSFEGTSFNMPENWVLN